jgi:very-short-patch-repair endonuclease
MSSGKMGMSQSVVQKAKELCRELRKRSTRSELLFWQKVRNRKVLGKKFLRQYPIFFMYMDKKTFFIADFYCHENRLVVEIDGKNHDYQREYDELRTYIINNLDIEVVRFRNEEIERNISGVLERLRAVLIGQTHPKSLS